MELIRVKDLTVKYNNSYVFKDLSFSIQKGDYIAIVGPNGAGKTTLIKAILGLIEKEHGTIQFNTKKIGYLQQRLFLNDPKFPANVYEIIKSGLLINKKSPKIFTKKDIESIEKIIKEFEIEDLKHKLIGNLSGGEIQKVLLARALVSKPEILFLDEPTTALDPASRENFYEKLKDINEKENITIILVTHDIGSVGKYAKKMLYLNNKIVFFGTFKEFCESKDMTEYFGDISQHFFCHRHDN